MQCRGIPQLGRWWVTLAVAAVPVLVSMVLVSVARDFSWDEAVYFARASGHEQWQPLWGPQRSLGMPLMVAPAAVLTDTAMFVRLWSSLCAVALGYVCLRLWQGVLGRGVLVWWLLACTTWPFVWFATEWYPNWFIAVVFAAMLGWSARVRRGMWAPAALGVVLGVAAMLIRPGDALILLAGAAVAAGAAELLGGKPRRGALMATVRSHWPLAAGYGIGVGVFAVETQVLFGGLRQRLDDTFTFRPPPTEGLEGHLSGLVNAAAFMSVPPGRVVVLGVQVAVLVGLGVAGMVVASRRDRQVLVPAAGAAVAITAFYSTPGLDYNSFGRFLLPSIVLVALLATPLWGALARRLRPATPRRWVAATSGIVIVVAILGVLNLQLIRERSEVQGPRAGPRQIAAILEQVAAGQPCAFGTQFSRPQIQLHTSCQGVRLRAAEATPESWPGGGDAPVAFIVGPAEPRDEWRDAGFVPVDTVGRTQIWVRR